MIKAVFFDFDGTLLNSLNANVVSYNYMFKKMHLPKMSINKFKELFNVDFHEFERAVGVKENQLKKADKLWE